MYQVIVDFNNGWRAKIGCPIHSSDNAVKLMWLVSWMLAKGGEPLQSYCARIDVLSERLEAAS